MAIAKIKKLEIIGLEKDKDNLLSLLQKLGMMELIKIEERSLESVSSKTDLSTNPLEIEEAISYLASFKEKAATFAGIVTTKPLVYQQQLKEIIASFDYRAFLKELSELRNHLKDILQHKEKLIQERHLLSCWRNLAISLDEIHPTQSCGIILGVLNKRDHAHLLGDCQKGEINLFCEVIYADKANVYLAVLYVLEEFEALEAILKSYHFNFITLSRYKGTVRDRLLEINREEMVFDDQIEEIKERMRLLAAEQFKVMVVYDYLSNINKREEAKTGLLKQQYTFTLSGWMRQKDVRLLEKAITDNFRDVVLFISEPEGLDVPVILQNIRILQPFEFITNIYGMPKYNELDPTPFLAPFFFLYFGFCVSDVGYGLMLVLFCLFMLKKLRLGPQGLRFFRLFLYCGISTVIVGALTGSWFGNLLDLLGEANKIFLPLKQFKDSLVMLDPLKEPTKLLGIALFLGIIQVWFGNIVAALGNIKNKRYLDIVLDQVPMLTLLFGLTGLGLISLKLLGNTHIGLFKSATLLAAIAFVFTQGRREKGIAAKLFYGAYNLYSALSGYLSDILSYSRLWALGLVTGVMANTVNLISVQFSSILISLAPFLSKINWIKILVSSLILIMLFVFGHLVSFLMNLLGAFVHPLRLQFVEFFSKFFKSGGSSFKPFKIETKYINISEDISYGDSY